MTTPIKRVGSTLKGFELGDKIDASFIPALPYWELSTAASTVVSLSTSVSTGLSTATSSVNSLSTSCSTRLTTLTSSIDSLSTSTSTIANTLPFVQVAAVNQMLPTAIRTYIAGSAVTYPMGKLKVGTVLRWTLDISKTAAGVSPSTIDIAIGTTGTTFDGARVEVSKPAGSAAPDIGKLIVEATVTATGTTATLPMSLTLHKQRTSGGFLTGSTAAGYCGYNPSLPTNVTATTTIGLCYTTGAAEVVTVHRCFVEVLHPK